MPQLVSHGPHETPGEGSCVSVSRRGFRTNNPKVVELSTFLAITTHARNAFWVYRRRAKLRRRKKTPLWLGDGRIFDPSGPGVSPA